MAVSSLVISKSYFYFISYRGFRGPTRFYEVIKWFLVLETDGIPLHARKIHFLSDRSFPRISFSSFGDQLIKTPSISRVENPR